MLFSEIIGFEPQKKLLRKIRERGVFSRAIILHGIKGQGKSLFVRDIARDIFTSNASNAANAARLFDSQNHPDFFIVKDQKNTIKIDQIRSVIEFLGMRPVISPYRVVYIKHADKMTVESANSFLKTLEEPPDDCLIFLSLETLEELPETVISRCICVHFPHLLPEQITKISRQINPKLSDEAIGILGQLSGGGIIKEFYEDDKDSQYTGLYHYCMAFIKHPNDKYLEGIGAYLNELTALNGYLSVFKLLSRILVDTYQKEWSASGNFHKPHMNKYISALEAVIEYQKAWEANAAKNLCLYGMLTSLRQILLR